MGTVVGASGAIMVYCSVCLYVPNAELALMFIPVQLRQNISTSLVLVDLYLGVSGQSILVGGITFCSRWRCFIWLSNYVVLEEESV
jgi:hypothetical protein